MNLKCLEWYSVTCFTTTQHEMALMGDPQNTGPAPAYNESLLPTGFGTRATVPPEPQRKEVINASALSWCGRIQLKNAPEEKHLSQLCTNMVSLTFSSPLSDITRNSRIPLCRWALVSVNPSYCGVTQQGMITYLRLVGL